MRRNERIRQHSSGRGAFSAAAATSTTRMPGFVTLGEAQAACVSSSGDCAGVTYQDGIYQLRSGSSFLPNVGKVSTASWMITDMKQNYNILHESWPLKKKPQGILN
jgi:hypothetical protein